MGRDAAALLTDPGHVAFWRLAATVATPEQRAVLRAAVIDMAPAVITELMQPDVPSEASTRRDHVSVTRVA